MKNTFKCVVVAAIVVTLALAGAPRPDPSPPESAGNTVHFHFLMDRSGSMAPLQRDVVGGFNSYIATQQDDTRTNPGDRVLLSLVQFDTEDPHEITIDGSRIQDVAPITAAEYSPRGGTPLFDAISRVVARAESMRQPEELTTVIIFTDGEENSSREHSRASVNKLIDSKKEEGWQFIFLGANQDAFAEGGSIGIGRASSQNYVADTEGMASAFSSLAGASNNYRKRAREAKRASVAMSDASEAEAYMQESLSSAADSFFEGFDDAQQDYEQRTQQKQDTL